MGRKFSIPDDEYVLKSHKEKKTIKSEKKQPTIEVQEVQEEYKEQDVHEVQEDKTSEYGENGRPYGVTQGKKGQHAKRINMAFSDRNYEYIKKESRRNGMSATEFVNMIIDAYRGA